MQTTPDPIRPCAPAELAQAVALAAAPFAAYGPYDAILRGWSREPGVRTLVAPHAGGPRGMVMFAWMAEARGPVGYILAVTVAELARGVGLGQLLLRSALATLAAEAAAVGGTLAELAVADENTAGRALFAGCGFRPAPGGGVYPNGQPYTIMRRSIQALPETE